MRHPSGLALEAFACDTSAAPAEVVATSWRRNHDPASAGGAVAAHVDECAECKQFVDRSRTLALAGRSAAEADDAVARALARTMARSEAPALPPVGTRHANARDGNARDEGPSTPPRPLPGARRRSRAWWLASSVAAPLATAAAVFVLARPAHRGTALLDDVPAPSESTSTNEGLGALAAQEPAPAGRGETIAVEPDTTFKGSVQLMVVRERGKDQTRFSSVVRVRPGDRLRVEVALDREQAILAGVLADDGTFLELMPRAVRGPGTHFSERSAKIDAVPAHGTIVLGSPEAIGRVRTTKKVEGVASLRVEWEKAR